MPKRLAYCGAQRREDEIPLIVDLECLLRARQEPDAEKPVYAGKHNVAEKN